EDAGPQTVALTGITSGAANESQRLTITARSSNPALIPNPSVSYTSPGTSGSLTFASLVDANGSAPITVTVNDRAPTNNVFSRTFTVHVTPDNDPPTLTDIPNQTTDEDTPISVPVVVHDAETPAADLLLTASSSNTNLLPSAGLVFNGTGASRTLT